MNCGWERRSACLIFSQRCCTAVHSISAEGDCQMICGARLNLQQFSAKMRRTSAWGKGADFFGVDGRKLFEGWFEENIPAVRRHGFEKVFNLVVLLSS